MGRVKGKYLEDLDSGYTSGRDLNVCDQHFNDEDIIDFIKENGSSDLVCSFCSGNNVEDQIKIYKIICWDDLMERIITSIKYFYDDPANGLYFESAGGGYLGNTYDTIELLHDIIGLEADYKVVQEIADSITQDSWTEGEFYGETYLEYLDRSWETFSNLVKYKVRYLFNEIESDLDDLSSKPFHILNDIGNYISKLDLVFPFPKETILQDQNISIYRARQHKEEVEVVSCKEIGSPPKEYSAANRFSPEGISMFYGANDKIAAINEIINKNKKQELISIAEFYPSKQLNLIDLRKIPRIGLFNIENLELIEPSRFLRNFVSSVSKKLEKDGNERIEYIPSQIVMEYFRHLLPSTLGIPIHGIIYKSTHDNSKDCFAFFADSSSCNDMGTEKENTLLILKKNSIEKIRVSDYIDLLHNDLCYSNMSYDVFKS